MDRYLNVVRAGSKASDPSATNLDTGTELEVETLRLSPAVDRALRDWDTPEDIGT